MRISGILDMNKKPAISSIMKNIIAVVFDLNFQKTWLDMFVNFLTKIKLKMFLHPIACYSFISTEKALLAKRF